MAIDELNIKLSRFNQWMIRELNANNHKGSILEFKDFDKIVTELEYHKSKMMIAFRCSDKQAAKEYIADTANFLFCLGNLGGLYDDDFVDLINGESMEIRKDKDVFNCVTEPQLGQNISFKK